jgi:chemotaxis protein MotB
MAHGKPHAEEPEDEAWLMTYADMITLLMAFFVMLASVSKVDFTAYDGVREQLSQKLSRSENKEVSKAAQIQAAMKDVITSEGADEAVQMGTDAQGSITLTLDSGAFFKPGSADLLDQAIPVLKAMTVELGQPIYNAFNISVEGHTDDEPINSPRFPSNWDLSASRAATVVKFFLGEKFDAKRMRAVGYADTHPLRANRDPEGKPIPENMAANRRVVMRINRAPIFEEIRTPHFRREDPDAKKVEKKVEAKH